MRNIERMGKPSPTQRVGEWILMILFDLARSLGDVPLGLHIGQLLALLCPLITGIGQHQLLLAMQQVSHLVQVMLIGGRGNQAVSQATLGIDPYVGLHPEVPLIALLGLMHLGVALLGFVFGRAGSLNDGGIDQRPLLHHDAGLREPMVEGLEELARQLVQLKADGGSS